MKRTLGILMTAVATVMAVFAMTGCANTDQMQSDIDRLVDQVTELTDKVDDLTSENAELTDKVDGLTSENVELTDKVNNLNVFWTDKTEYGEHETMTVYFKNQPVLKIRIDFDNSYETALWGGSVMNYGLYITSLCANIYASTIVDTTFAVSNSGSFVRISSSGTRVLNQNVETTVPGRFDCSNEAYENATWFDLVICVPGTPFELARFKNVSYTKQ